MLAAPPSVLLMQEDVLMGKRCFGEGTATFWFSSDGEIAVAAAAAYALLCLRP